jgi:DNA-binding NarL/FixJ family response regulator
MSREACIEGQIVRVGVFDPSTLFRQSLEVALERCQGIEVLPLGESTAEAEAAVLGLCPEVLLLEPGSLSCLGLDLLEVVARRAPQVRVLVLTQVVAFDFALKVLRRGAHGYLTKASDLSELLRAIRAVSAGGRYVPSSLERQIAHWVLESGSSRPPAERISNRELQVMRLLAVGWNHHRIAEDLHISVKTVDTHRLNLLRKLALGNNVELARFALRNGLAQL